ncbi:MAG: hypothetical protein ACOYJB_03135 [Christensenellaceae bacterium]|jgi:serine/threonine-protein kinase RsbW
MTEIIRMQFPANANYISAIRLAVSGIAGNMDYNIEEIEDLKSCIGEACILFLCGEECKGVDIAITLSEQIDIAVEGRYETKTPAACGECTEFSGEISKIMIQSLSDDAVFEEEDDVLRRISFSKIRAAV